VAAVLSGAQGRMPQYLISRDGNLAQMERVDDLLEVMGLRVSLVSPVRMVSPQ
jgi:hypothetical protein